MEVIDFRKSNFVMIPRKLIEDNTLKHRDKVIYATLCLFTNNTSKCSYPSIEKIAVISSISKMSVYRALSELEKNGYIKRESRYSNDNSQLTNRYYLLDI